MIHKPLKKLLFVACAALALVGCSEATVTSPGENAQVDSGGSGGRS
jgi:PBP1b-binding outer membrane lipoprotein LpoB